MVQNGTNGTDGQSTILIKDLGVLSTGSTSLAVYGGWIGQRYFGKGVGASNNINNCYSLGVISGPSAGGIFGANDDNGTATNCYIANNAWNDTDASSNLINEETVWLDYDTSATNVPWVLRSFLAAYDQSVTTNEDTSVQIDLAAYDQEGGTLTYSIVTQPQNGTLS